MTQTTLAAEATKPLSLATLVIRFKFERMLRALDSRYTPSERAWFRSPVTTMEVL